MKFRIDTSQNILSQFSAQLASPIVANRLSINGALGKGWMKRFPFPDGLELYHLVSELNHGVEMQAKNPIDSEYLLLNINLANTVQRKKVNNQPLDFQRFLPTGILFYTPQTEVRSSHQAGEKLEVALVQIPRQLFQHYQMEVAQIFDPNAQALLYEDLDQQSENLLRKALQTETIIEAHSYALGFLARMMEKLRRRSLEQNVEKIHPDDLKGLFLAAATLRNPLAAKVPNLDELARMAGMGKTKFKQSFKQVFGQAPGQYHLSLKMEYARQILQSGQKTPTEIAYELGYSHPSKFTQAYKKQFGQVPSASTDLSDSQG